MKFSDIIGHTELKRRLAAGIDGGRISHAQLFVGAAGSGTLALALAYTQYLHCTNRQNGDSCGECSSCRQIEKLAHPDLHLVFPVNKQVLLLVRMLLIWVDHKYILSRERKLQSKI